MHPPLSRALFESSESSLLITLGDHHHLDGLVVIGRIDRATVYVSLAPDMEHPTGVDPLAGNATRCYRYTSSDEDDNQPMPTTDDRLAGKRPVGVLTPGGDTNE